MRYLYSLKRIDMRVDSLRANAVSHKQIDAAENVEMLILHLIFIRCQQAHKC